MQVNRNRNRLAASFLALAAFALCSCSGTETQPTEQPLEPAIALSADQLVQVLSDFSKDDKGAKVISDAELRASIPAAQEWLESAEVNPSKCGVTFAAPITEQLQHSVIGALESGDQYITVAVYPDTATLRAQWDAQEKTSADCARFSVKVAGESRAYHLAKQPLSTQNELNEAYVVTGSDGKQTSQQLIIHSASGNILVGIQQATSSSKTSEQLTESSNTISELFEQLN